MQKDVQDKSNHPGYPEIILTILIQAIQVRPNFQFGTPYKSPMA
ncbi:Uncharacterized protein dnl_55050 [Desulfonema limicola]|uniref:Uncharacterized protein n=1 Tax=Desulfonema limicola TaxID=45656 RepID=A0A975GJ34_9BACT|nr:hypothetical protein [Desulfonema limicola]QTA83111.1 Uncharacterized protein dnl_55050 [Desulfonema limicola]